jgi:hypothetical protein
LPLKLCQTYIKNPTITFYLLLSKIKRWPVGLDEISRGVKEKTLSSHFEDYDDRFSPYSYDFESVTSKNKSLPLLKGTGLLEWLGR